MILRVPVPCHRARGHLGRQKERDGTGIQPPHAPPAWFQLFSPQAASPQHPSPTRKTQPLHPLLLPTCPEAGGGGLLCDFPSPKKQSRRTCPETGAAPRSTASSAGVPFPPESDAPVRGVPRRRLLPEESSPKSWLGGCAGALAKPRALWCGKELSGESPRIPGFCKGQWEVNAEQNRPIRGRSVALEAAEILALVGWRGAEAARGPPGSWPSAKSSAQARRETRRRL